MTRVLYAGKARNAEGYRAALLALRPGLDLVMDPAEARPESVDIVLYEPSGPLADLAPYAGAAAIQSLWAGVETLLENDSIPEDVPLLRMVEDGLTEGMTDYVVGHVYAAHLGMLERLADQRKTAWTIRHPPLARDRRVGIVGLGALGQDAARALAGLRFAVSGWSRSAKTVAGVRCLHGPEGLDTLLRESEILVLLAPLTDETRGLIDAAALARMPRGAHLINAARGPLIDDDALLAALDAGQIASAALDVFDTEPLPEDHPYWRHPKVIVTPHIASVTRIESAACTILRQIERLEAGKPFDHVVDRSRGY